MTPPSRLYITQVIRKAVRIKLIEGVVFDRNISILKIERVIGVREIIASGLTCRKYLFRQ